MLRDLTIKNYRAFKDFSIDGLARVNLIVGKNNAGKTSFLEAVYLLVNQGSPATLIELLDGRGEYVIDAPQNTQQGAIRYQLAPIFSGGEPTMGAEISFHSVKDSAISVSWATRPRAEALFNEPALELVASYKTAIPDVLGRRAGHNTLPLHANYDYISSNRFSPATEGNINNHFVAVAPMDFDNLADLWDRIIRDPSKEAIVTQALQLVEPRIEDIRFTSRRTAGGTLAKLHNQSTRVTVSSLGEGVRRILALVMSALISKNGVLLIDEIDTGLYHGVQTQMWQLLIEIAQRLNIQIFTTTHSWDCVAAFQEALNSNDNHPQGRLFRLEVQGDHISAVRYDADDLDIAVRQAIEVR